MRSRFVTGCRRLARALCLAGGCTLSLAGCNQVYLGYSNLDTFATWSADEHFDLDLRQKQEFRTRFAKLHAWHRYEQLPEYAAFLSETKTRVEHGVTRADFLWAVGGVQERYRTIIRHSTDDAAAILVTITPDQIQTLQRQFDKTNRKFVREYRLDASAEEQRRAAARRTVTRIREWAGNLTLEQEKRITAMARDLPLIHGLRHEDRMRRQREFVQLLKTREDPKFAQRLRHFLLNWEEDRDPRYERMFRESTEKHAELYVAISAMLTPVQRAAVARKVQGYIDDFTRLAQRPGAHAEAGR
jgi:hypothetical protein